MVEIVGEVSRSAVLLDGEKLSMLCVVFYYWCSVAQCHSPSPILFSILNFIYDFEGSRRGGSRSAAS